MELFKDNYQYYLRQRMLVIGMAQKELAEKAGISVVNTNNVLKKCGPKKNIKKICAALGIPFDFILKDIFMEPTLEGPVIESIVEIPRLLKVGDVAKILRCSPGHAYSLIRVGKIQAINLCRVGMRVLEAELDTFIKNGGIRRRRKC